MEDLKMTVKEFLEKGLLFVDDDIYSNQFGEPVVVGGRISYSSANDPCESDCERFVISAKALEQKPKRTKTVIERVNFTKLSDAFLAFEQGGICFEKGSLMNEKDLVDTMLNGESVYKKEDIETTPLQAAKDAALDFIDNSSEVDVYSNAYDFIDSKNIEYIDYFRSIVNAFDNKE